MKNMNNTAAAIAAIQAIMNTLTETATTAITAIEAIMATVTTTETATTETTTAETTEATTTTETATEIKNQITIGDLDKIADEASAMIDTITGEPMLMKDGNPVPTPSQLKRQKEAEEMIDQNPCDPNPVEEIKNQISVEEIDKIAAEETTADETTGDLPCPPDAAETAAEDADDPATPSEEILDKIIADISALFYIAEYSLYNEAEKIGHDNSPYSPKDNTVGDIGDYKIFISKEIIKSADHVEGSFRMIIKDKVIVNPICDYDVRIIDNHIKVFSSENTVRVEKMKENHKVVKFLEVVDDTCYLVKDKYISE